jgi:hypothetical protein
VYDRRNSGVAGWEERAQKKEKRWRDLDVGTRKEKTGIGWKAKKEGAECAMKRERQLSTWNGCSEMRERERERGRERNGKKY